MARRVPLHLALVVGLAAAAAPAEDVFWEESGTSYPYDLKAARILVLVGDGVDAQETALVTGHWRQFGATVELAGPSERVTAHRWRRDAAGWQREDVSPLVVDLRLADVDLARYAAVFVPGGDSPSSLLASSGARVRGLLRDAVRRGLVVAAICHGPRLLAAADVVRGRSVTGHPELRDELVAAGATLVTATAITDGPLVTGNWPYFETFAVRVAERLLYPTGGGPSERSLFETNPVLRAITGRRSVRAFQTREVPAALVEQLLTAASWAPSADNSQPWRFIVVRRREAIEALQSAVTKAAMPELARQGLPPDQVRAYWASVFGAPVLLAAFAVPSSGSSDPAVARSWEAHATAAACENLLLAAHAVGLGSVWVGSALLAEREIRTILGAPDAARLVALMPLGFPAEEPLPPVRRQLSATAADERWPASWSPPQA